MNDCTRCSARAVCRRPRASSSTTVRRLAHHETGHAPWCGSSPLCSMSMFVKINCAVLRTDGRSSAGVSPS